MSKFYRRILATVDFNIDEVAGTFLKAQFKNGLKRFIRNKISMLHDKSLDSDKQKVL